MQLLGVDDPDTFMQVLEQVKLRLKKAPVLVLDIPRSTTEGRPFSSFFLFFNKVWTQSPASPRRCQRTWTCYMPGPRILSDSMAEKPQEFTCFFFLKKIRSIY